MEGCLVQLISLLLFAPTAHADAVNNEWYSTTRSQSMGNVGVASAEDPATAMFFNPAALSRTKKAQVEIFNPQFEVGEGVLTGSGLSIANHSTLDKARPELQKNPGRVSSLGAAIYPNVSAQNFNFGILGRGEGSSYYYNDRLHYISRYYLIPNLGLSIGSFGSRLRLGVAVRGIQATTNDKEVLGTGSSANGYTVDAAEGFGIGLDAGTTFSLPWEGLPTFAVVARNIGDTSFSGTAPAGVGVGTLTKKDKIKMTYDAGFAFFPKLGRKSNFVFAVDYRDATQVHNVTTLRRLNLGMEINLNKVFYLRAGMSRGYWTAGLGLASKAGSLDIGTYSEELDERSFRAREDRRLSIRYGSRF